jgi:hypothetical protein
MIGRAKSALAVHHGTVSWRVSCLAAIGLWLTPGGAVAQTGAVLVPTGAVWRFLDNGTNFPNTLWRTVSFNHASWGAGPAPLGYGETWVVTPVSYGPDSDNKHVTTYFRHAFTVSSPAAFNRVFLDVQRDDGVVVYLNGTEVYRNNLLAGAISAATFATTNVYGGGETAFQRTDFPFTLLAGTNVLGVELHQAGADSIDLAFDLRLAASNVLPVTRGPYLQSGTPTGIVIRWRTSQPSDSQVWYGTDPGNLNQLATDAVVTTEHLVELSGLAPDIRYYYAVGAGSGPVAGGPGYSFLTAPTGPKPTRIWVIGDSGTATQGAFHKANQERVRDAYYALTGSRPTDVWLLLGDNAYYSGTDQQYQAAFFDIYPTLMRQTVPWTAVGNHETYATGNFDDYPYLQIFSPPTDGRAGGIASGTKKYYSFDYGDIHFVCLDSMSVERTEDGAQYVWLEQDLAANTKTWIIAYWHHPPYTKGSHNSDTEIEHIEMRETYLPLLEAYGVDLVLGGHSHNYERSVLLHGHYGYSDSLTPQMKLNPGDGRSDGDGSYVKLTMGPTANQGAVYAVVGCSGWATFQQFDWPHPVMAFAETQLGSMVIDVDGNTLYARFLRDTMAVDDYFTIVKSGGEFRITTIRRDDARGVYRVEWNTLPNRYYRVYRASRADAPPSEWFLVSPGLYSDDSLSLFWEDPIDDFEPVGFYRVENYPD